MALEPWRAALDYASSLVARGPAPTGDGHCVLVLPGLATGDWSTLPLRRVLNRAGFCSNEWGMGINRGPDGDLDEWLGRLEARLMDLHRRSERRVSLVGWSLGGIYARELAKRTPELVRQVITLGSPFGDLQASRVSGVFRWLNGGKAQLTPRLQHRLRENPPVPTTAIYSRTDGVVGWQGCILEESPRAQNIEVSRASHCGLGVHPEVLRIVAERLSQPEGQWKRATTC